MTKRLLMIAFVLALTVLSADATETLELPARTSTVRLPEVYALGIANPFPTLYAFNADGRLVLHGKGKDAPVFEFDLSKLADRPLPRTELVEKVENYFEGYNEQAKRLAPHAEYYFFFFELDPESFGGEECQPCVALRRGLIEDIAESRNQIYLEVIATTNP